MTLSVLWYITCSEVHHTVHYCILRLRISFWWLHLGYLPIERLSTIYYIVVLLYRTLIVSFICCVPQSDLAWTWCRLHEVLICSPPLVKCPDRTTDIHYRRRMVGANHQCPRLICRYPPMSPKSSRTTLPSLLKHEGQPITCSVCCGIL